MPTLGNLCPVDLFWRSLEWEFIECFFDVRKWDTNPLGRSYEGDSPQYVSVETSLVPFISRTENETFAFVEMESGNGDTASNRNLSD